MSNSLNTNPPKTPARDLAILDRLFPENTEKIKVTRALLGTIFHCFEITNDFSYNLKFLVRLEYVLKIGHTNNAHLDWDKFDDFDLSETWGNWLAATSEALRRHKEMYGTELAYDDLIKKTGSKQANFLLQKLNEGIYEHQIGLFLLYTAFLMLPPSRSEKFNLKEITRNFSKAVTLDAVFKEMPLDFRNIQKETFLENISSKCQKLLQTRRFGDKHNDFLRRLDDVARLFLAGKHKHNHKRLYESELLDIPTDKPKNQRPSTQRFTAFHDQPQMPDTPPIGKFETLINDPSEEPIQGLMEAKLDDPERLLIPKVNKDAELRVGSKFWIQNFGESITWNLNGINPMTRKILVSWIKESRSQEALIFTLMLAIGLKIPSLMKLVIGKNKDISLDGQYRRTYKRPPEHFRPDETTKHLLIATEDNFTVLLPDIAISLLQEQIGHESENLTLSQALNTSTEDSEKNISRIIKELIKQGAIGLARDRIHLSLRKQISTTTGDDFLGYLITGTKKEAPPVSSYYSQISQTHIQNIYNRAISELFS